jgi:2-polyprenyl-3-methyl-5-hydroxy-6-metoxy-1,4-benzoquinol methylase
MKYYHWGVYVTTFAWEHHLKIMQFFRQQFLPLLQANGTKDVIEFGAGSGVWSLLLTQSLKGSHVTGIDISPYSVQVANNFVSTLGRQQDVEYHQGDAITFKAQTAKQAGLCCFLVEHLEHPENLLANLRENIMESSYAFITTALTAAESDHIYEFRFESEVLKLMEENGFRVIASFSSAPPNHTKKSRFLPRSIALVVQKRHNDIW